MSVGLSAVIGLGMSMMMGPVGARQAVFRSQVEVVRVDVAISRGGTAVAGLGVRDFELYDSGVRQAIREVLVETVPIDVTLLLDVSTSVEGLRLERLQEAAASLVRGLRPGDRAALMTFGHRISLRQPLTTDLDAVARLLANIEANGSTALHDAIFTGLLQRPADDRRAVLVVFSDGIDTVSWLSSAQVLDAARRSTAIVYAVAEMADPDPISNETAALAKAFLKNVADETSGRTWWVADPGQFREAFGRILREITTRYVLLYQPEGVDGDGWHPISVTLTRARGEVAARAGYYR